jgi:hypothetical protein
MLNKGTISKLVVSFIQEAKKTVQTDSDVAIKNFADSIESAVYAAIREADILIPAGALTITTPQGPGVNLKPILLKKAIQ